MSRFERWVLWVSAAASAVSGIGLLWTKYFIQNDEAWAVINHPWQPAFLKAHIITTPFLVFALGLIATRHIWTHYRSGITRGRRSGMATVLTTVPMVISGYLIQLVTHVELLLALAVAHIALGLLFTVKLILHQSIVRLKTGQAATPEDESPGRGRPRKVERSLAAAPGD